MMWTHRRETYYARQNGNPLTWRLTPAQRQRLVKKQRRNVRIAWDGAE